MAKLKNIEDVSMDAISKLMVKATGRCKNCKWWTPWELDRFGLGFCSRVDAVNKGIDHDGCGIIFTSGEADAELATGPDFGCVHWEAK